MHLRSRHILFLFCLILAPIYAARPARAQDAAGQREALFYKIDLTDERLVKDLYGREISRDFYVVIVRICNGVREFSRGRELLRCQKSGPQHLPVIIYRDSVEVSVEFEVKDNNRWRPITSAELEAISAPAPNSEPSRPAPAARPDECKSATQYRPLSSGQLIVKYDLGRQARANLSEQGFKDLEMVPAGAEVTRTLFIPKTAIRGLVRDREVRISSICPHRLGFEYSAVTETKRNF
jgi:hypothetical protein